jgi:hypothetical protein
MMVALAVVGAFVLVLLPLSVLLLREVEKTQKLFSDLARQRGGKTTRLPAGCQFELEGIPVRIYALKGGIHYTAKVSLREDPRILVTRTFKKLASLDGLNFSLSRTKYLLHSAIDSHFGFRAKDSTWLREIFSPAIQEQMIDSGRVGRIEIRKRTCKGGLIMLYHSEREAEITRESIELMNAIVLRLSTSSLAAR